MASNDDSRSTDNKASIALLRRRPRPLRPSRRPGGWSRCQAPVSMTVATAASGVEWEHGGDFNFNIEDFNFYVDESMLRYEPEPGLQQPTIAEPEHDDQFIQLPCGPVLAAEACTVGDMLGPETAVQRGAESKHEHGDKLKT
ncbi:unnamed protein product [Miscanthus lutarioriparius]|uniref:Uncharacterized protein n=1 Tax=Miscanthus lutarioriparius TaxID=422564 RepID=A0A811RXX3_9POAL|nr:unnamed protein product [Miscanthus lutarioriparius]